MKIYIKYKDRRIMEFDRNANNEDILDVEIDDILSQESKRIKAEVEGLDTISEGSVWHDQEEEWVEIDEKWVRLADVLKIVGGTE